MYNRVYIDELCTCVTAIIAHYCTYNDIHRVNAYACIYIQVCIYLLTCPSLYSYSYRMYIYLIRYIILCPISYIMSYICILVSLPRPLWSSRPLSPTASITLVVLYTATSVYVVSILCAVYVILHDYAIHMIYLSRISH